MKLKSAALVIGFAALAVFQTGMGRHEHQYDQEARSAERAAREAEKSVRAKNPATGIAEGIRSATLDSTTGFIAETAEEAREKGPVIGTLEGARRGTGVVLDKTVKGAVKVATLGQGDLEEYEVREPEANTGEPTRITIKIPGT